MQASKCLVLKNNTVQEEIAAAIITTAI